MVIIRKGTAVWSVREQDLPAWESSGWRADGKDYDSSSDTEEKPVRRTRKKSDTQE